MDLGPPNPLTIIPTAGRTASVPTVQPRIAAARGAARHDHKKVNRGSTDTGTGIMRRRCARLQTLGYTTLNDMLSLGRLAVLEGSYLAKSRTRPCLDTCTRRLDPPPRYRAAYPLRIRCSLEALFVSDFFFFSLMLKWIIGLLTVVPISKVFSDN